MADDEERRPLLDARQHDDADNAASSNPNRSLKSVLLGSSSLTQLEKLLCALSLAMLCLAAVGFGLFAGEAYRLGEELKKGKGRDGGPARPTSTLSATQTRSTLAPLPTPTSGPPHKNVCTLIMLMGYDR